MNKVRKLLYPHEAELLGLKVKPNRRHDSKQNTYYISVDDYNQIMSNRIKPKPREFVETLRKKDRNGKVTNTIEKLQSEPIDIPDNFEVIKISTSKTTGQQWVQYAAKQPNDTDEIDFDSIVSKYIKRVDVEKVKTITDNDFDVLTYTDLHVGMDTDKFKNSMYPILWNSEEVLNTANMIVQSVLANRTSSVLIIDDLGDLLDGYDGKTTRGGHELPQNMTNEESFDTGLEFKMTLLEKLIPFYDRIVFNNICNDNHAGAFGYFVNSAFKSIAELKYRNVTVANYRQFINHYFHDNICFVITHGKDDKALKFGFKPHIDARSVEKLDQYCKHNDIYSKSDLVIVKKGDSHQALFDMCGSDDFYYYNYPAASPSSNWIQSNFKKGRRGWVIEHYKGSQNKIVPVFM